MTPTSLGRSLKHAGSCAAAALPSVSVTLACMTTAVFAQKPAVAANRRAPPCSTASVEPSDATDEVTATRGVTIRAVASLST